MIDSPFAWCVISLIEPRKVFAYYALFSAGNYLSSGDNSMIQMPTVRHALDHQGRPTRGWSASLVRDGMPERRRAFRPIPQMTSGPSPRAIGKHGVARLPAILFALGLIAESSADAVAHVHRDRAVYIPSPSKAAGRIVVIPRPSNRSTH